MKLHFTRRAASIFIMIVVLFLSVTAAAAPSDYNKDAPANLQADYLYGESTVLLDGDTREVLFSKNSRVRMYPASTTKIMTALVALEHKDCSEEVEIPSECVGLEGGGRAGVQ